MHALLNWFSQIASITKFGLMSIPQRRGAVFATVVGIAGVESMKRNAPVNIADLAVLRPEARQLSQLT